MWHTTEWAIKTWLKTTVALALGVVGVWLFTDGPGYTTAAITAAGLVEVWTVRALCREWVYNAHLWCWWWPK